jgi:hypothetical protein
MDPDANLKRQREVAAEIEACSTSDTRTLASLADELAELVVSLDEWLLKGGFLPADWAFRPHGKQ